MLSEHVLADEEADAVQEQKDEREERQQGKKRQRGGQAGAAVPLEVFEDVEKEAQDWLHYTAVENCDKEAVDNLVNLQFAHAHSFPHDLLAQIKHLFAMGHGGFPLVGTPDQVAAGIVKLHETGFAGTTLSFVDYIKEFPYFRDEVLPRLEKAGIR